MAKLRTTVVVMLSMFFLSSVVVEAAYIVQPNGKGDSNFSAPSGFNGTSTTAGEGTLSALGLTPGAASVFGGDEYLFSYTPGTDGDNTTFTQGDQRNQFAKFIASGQSAASSNRFRVYRVHPESNNVTGGPVNYEIFVNGLSTGIAQSVDQNLDINDPVAVSDALDTGSNIGLWELIGEVVVSAASDTVTVVQAPTSSTYVSMRAAGIMFEAIPEPSTCLLLTVATLLMSAGRRLQ